MKSSTDSIWQVTVLMIGRKYHIYGSFAHHTYMVMLNSLIHHLNLSAVLIMMGNLPWQTVRLG